MFFNRIGSDSMSFEPPTLQVSSSCRNSATDPSPLHAHRHQRRAAALTLAVAVTVPAMTGSLSSLLADEVPTLDLQAIAQATVQQEAVLAADGEAADLTDAQKLSQGTQLYENNQYEEALALLQQVQAENLASDRERQQLRDGLSRAQEAARQRQDARAAFEAGEQALADGQAQEAIRQYQAAARNRFADQGTRQKAQEKIAIAQAASRDAGTSLRATYNEAVADFRAGNDAEARAKFEQLHAAGFRAPLFQKSPRDYLNDIERRSGTATVQAEVDGPAEGTTVETTVETTGQTGVATTPGTDEQPAEVVVKTDEPTAPEVVVEIEEDDTTTVTGAPQLSRQERARVARESYRAGREAYQAGDYATARVEFERAREMNYRAGLFEDSPAKYLARIEQRQTAQATAERTTADETLGTDPEARAALEETARLESIRSQQDAFRAQELVVQAREAEARNEYQAARDLYTQAVQADPSNEAAVEGRDRMQIVVTGGTPRTIDMVTREREILRQEFEYQFDQNMADASAAIAAGEYGQAEAELNANRVLLQSRSNILTPEESRARAQEIANAANSLDRIRTETAVTERERIQREAEAQQDERERQERIAREETVRELITAAKRLIARKEYREASNVLDQVLQLDPQNEYAASVLPLVQDQFIIQSQRRFKEQFNDQLELQFNAAQEKLIPYDDIFRYPDNWPQLSRDRDALVAEEQSFSPEDIATQQLLDRRLPEIRFERVGLADAIDFLRDLTGANIYVNWGALQAQGVDQDAAVSARLRDVRMSKALNVILQDAGSSAPIPIRLDYSIEDGVITVSTAEDLAQNAVFVPRTYDLNDLLLTPREITESRMELGSSTGGGSRGGGGGGFSGSGGGGSGDSIFGDRDDDSDSEDDEERREEDLAAIIELIRASVPEDSWQDLNIDARGTVTERPRSGVLVVIQTPRNHQTINEVLTQLRQARGVQVSIETRFLTVSRSFLEDVGVDLDFQFRPTGHFGPISVTQDSADFTANPTTPVPSSIGAGVGDPSVSITGSFLDDFQADFLIRATQASETISSVNAPRLTLYNGQEAVLRVVRRQYYVSDLTPVVGSVGLFDPEISELDTGIEFSVRAAVTPDRKYVDMDLRPSLRSFNRFTSFAFQGEGTQLDDDGNQVAVPGGQVQLPDITVTEVQTFVTVPDGGTLLLGGQTLAGEVEREKGVPGLSKVPFLKRLFTNRATAKDDFILLILVKPTIIITREREEQAFPLLSTQIAQ